jgi:alpha-D-xyloside xylohydrolase
MHPKPLNPLHAGKQRRCGGARFRENKRLRVAFVTAAIARITFTDNKPFQTKPSLIVTIAGSASPATRCARTATSRFPPRRLTLVISRATGAPSATGCHGNLLLAEPERGGKWLTAKKITRNVFNKDAQIAARESIDGARATATDFQTVPDGDVFEAKLEFVFAKDEALFGLGSHEEGFGNLRGKSRELYQQNMKIVLPYFVSTHRTTACCWIAVR